jgi:transposase-like protein
MAKSKGFPTPADLTLDQIMRRFSTDEKAREYLEAIRWPEGPVCPHCGCIERIYPIESNPAKGVRPGLFQCNNCEGQFTFTVGTIFEKSKIPLRKWLVAWYMLCSSKKGVSALQIQRQLGIGSYRSAWFMMHRIRYALRDPIFDDKLGGTVEGDETYIGGVRHGKGRAYKGNKTAVVSLVERGGRVRSRVMHKVTGRNLETVLRANVAADANLMTDELPAYTKPGRMFKSHRTVNHGRKEYVRGAVHTNTVEGYFANLKRGIDGIYHHVGSQHLAQYLGEFDFRYNTRKLSDGERTVAGIAKAEGKRLMLQRPNSES